MAEEKREELEVNPGLTLQVLIDKVQKYNSGELSAEDFDKWGNELVIITSLPMLTKTNILIDIVERHVYNDMEMKEFVVCELYRNIFFYLYLGGYLGIRDIDPDDVNYSNYDLLEPVFGPWIEGVAGRDISIVKEMIDKSLQFYNTAQLSEALENVNLDNLDEAINSNQRLIKDLDENKDLIRDLRDIQSFENPLVADMVEKIRENSLTESKK